MSTTKLGIREQVKRGLLDAREALVLVDPVSKTHGWLSRRIKAAEVARKEAKK